MSLLAALGGCRPSLEGGPAGPSPQPQPTPTTGAPPGADHSSEPTTRPPSGPPSFVVFYGEARGWTSTSVQMDPEVPGSRSEWVWTPHLDRLAASGLVFSDFHAPSPRCMPSRASFLTGKSPARLHMTFVPEGASDGVVQGEVIPPEAVTTLPPSELTIASLLRSAGYATAHFGKWHAGRLDPSEYGFDESDGPTSNKGPSGEDHPNPAQAFETAARGIDFLRRQVAAERPFYLQISHYGGGAPEDALPETLAAEQERLAGQDPDLIVDAAIVRDMDASVGQVLDAVRELGAEDRTWLIFTADHGTAGLRSNEPLAGGKGTVREGGIRVPLLVAGPGVEAGRHTEVRASQVDLLPTLAELAGLEGPLPADLEGGSLEPVLRGSGQTVSRPFDEFVVHFPHYDKDPMGPASAILLGDRKLIRYYEDGSRRLFDLRQDLGEEVDLAPALPAEANELEARMDAYLQAVGAQMPGHL